MGLYSRTYDNIGACKGTNERAESSFSFLGCCKESHVDLIVILVNGRIANLIAKTPDRNKTCPYPINMP